MPTRIIWLLLIGVALPGCSPSNTPEPPPPPPVATGEPVAQTPTEPMNTPPVTNPPATISPVDPDRPTTAPIPPQPPQTVQPTVNVDEQIARLTSAADRQAAAVALASAGKAAVPALTRSLDHADWQVRAAAVFALGQIGSEANEAKARLQMIAEKDENSSVRDAAAFALDAIDSK